MRITLRLAMIKEALRAKLARRAAPQSRSKLKVTTFRGKGLRRGVDLDNSAALLDLLESV